MNFTEIFPDCSNIFKMHNDAAVKRANKTITTGKVQKKQADISKAKEKLKTNQDELHKLNKPQ